MSDGSWSKSTGKLGAECCRRSACSIPSWQPWISSVLCGTYAGANSGNPMMWSQCTWDMKMWKVVGRESPPPSAKRWPNARSPVPMSHST